MPQPTKDATTPIPYRQIRADYDSETITVYQAYNAEIARAAVAEQKLHASPLFKPSRMTWIKPSWAWMLYRAGYSYKDRGQERILALKMKHEHFIKLLEHGALAHQNPIPVSQAPQPAEQSLTESSALETSRDDRNIQPASSVQPEIGTGRDGKPQVRVQWDPERTIRLEKLPYRSIQIGIPAAMSPEWTETMIVGIEDVTEKARELKRVLDGRDDVSIEELVTRGLVPVEKVFAVPEHVQRLLDMI